MKYQPQAREPQERSRDDTALETRDAPAVKKGLD
jgi:hypothetical protein